MQEKGKWVQLLQSLLVTYCYIWTWQENSRSHEEIHRKCVKIPAKLWGKMSTTNFDFMLVIRYFSHSEDFLEKKRTKSQRVIIIKLQQGWHPRGFSYLLFKPKLKRLILNISVKCSQTTHLFNAKHLILQYHIHLTIQHYETLCLCFLALTALRKAEGNISRMV